MRIRPGITVLTLLLVAAAAMRATAQPPVATAAPASIVPPVPRLAVAATVAAAANLRAGGSAAKNYTVHVTDFGAQCNGRHDDKRALEAALSAVHAHGGGTVLIPVGACRVVQTGASSSTALRGPVTIKGVAAAATISLDRDVPDSFRELFKVTGREVTVSTIRLVRASAGLAVLLDIYGSHGFRMDNVVLDGRQNTIGGDGEGIELSGDAGEVISDVKITNATITNCAYGLFQASPTLVTVHNVSVDHATFVGNHDDDLEFNAPSSTMTAIRVTHSTFRDNTYTDPSADAGFGVGLAHVRDALLRNNSFNGYRYDPVHIEDRSGHITVDGNTFKNSFTAPLNYASHVFIVDNSHVIKITGNTFDTRGATNDIAAVYTSAGGGTAAPSDITITGNTFILRPHAVELANYGSPHVVLENNIVRHVP